MKMQKRQKILAVLLACLVITTLLAPGALAAADPSQQYAFTLSAAPDGGSEVNVAEGEEFTLELTLKRTDIANSNMSIYLFQDELQYSTEYLRVENVETVATGVTSGSVNMSNKIDKKVLIFLPSRSAQGEFVPYEYSPDELLARVTFTALKDGKTEVKQVENIVIKSNGADYYPSTANSVSINIGKNESVPHKITAENPANGTITTLPAGSAAEGTRVDLSIALRNNYALELWTVTGSGGEAVPVLNPGLAENGAYFFMPAHDVTVTAALKAPLPPVNPPTPENPGGGDDGDTAPPLITIEDSGPPLAEPDKARFDDVPKTYWAYTHVEYLAELGFVTGKTEKLFYPNDTITRGEFVTILARMSGENLPEFDGTFKDVDASAYYAKPIAWAIKTGVTLGTSATTFSPNDPIERQQIATMIARYAAYKGYGFGIVNEAIDFTDKAGIASYASAAVTAMQRANIIGGYTDGSFKPQNNATRAEAAKMLALVHNAMD